MPTHIERLMHDEVDISEVEEAVRLLLSAIGYNPSREGISDTPARVARMWQEFLNPPDPRVNSFEHTSTDQMVAVSGIKVWSMCEHHLLPFSADIAIGYITTNGVIGLSKMARIAQLHAGRLQLQERMVAGIADDLMVWVGSDVAVVASGTHTCMEMRGAKMPHTMHTQVLHGAFKENPATRQEFLELVGRV